MGKKEREKGGGEGREESGRGRGKECGKVGKGIKEQKGRRKDGRKRIDNVNRNDLGWGRRKGKREGEDEIMSKGE